MRKRPRKRNKDGTWRKKRSDAGKKREKVMNTPKVSRKIAVHFQEQCVCGQVHEVIHHMKEAEINVGFEPYKLPDLSKEFTAHVEPERKLAFSGACDKVDLHGMKWEKGRGVVCGKCGVDLVYGLIADMPEEPNVQIDRLDGSCPVQATGIIDDHSAFYFRGRHEAWQFVAGPKELSTDDLVGVKLGMASDDRVFVLEGDDEDRDYQDYDHVRNVLPAYAQQYIEWMNERKRQEP